MIEYIAHQREDGQTQPLAAHLQQTAALAEQFAAAFSAGSVGAYCGMTHDIGKYSDAAQQRLRGLGPKVDHATAGALEAHRAGLSLLGFCLAGHHGGLPDGGNFKADDSSATTLAGRLKRRIGRELPDYSQFQTEIRLPSIPLPEAAARPPFSLMFYIRMLYSALVDADFLDTERFMRPDMPGRGGQASLAELRDRLDDYCRRHFGQPQNDLNRRRGDILNTCRDAAGQQPGLFSLTVPTGAGKTIASLAFALRHGVEHGLSRVIYIVPYTSIIDQTVAVFSQILGAENVLAHHANVIYDDAEDELVTEQRLATENWDAPLIVTTAVQFYESLFACKPSRCRKLHNIAASVLIFDEVQLTPLSCLQPCLAAICELVRHYRSSVLLCTATRPDLGGLIGSYAPELSVRELCPQAKDWRDDFRRVHFRDAGVLDEAALAERLNSCHQVLCIVNSRALAADVYTRLAAEGAFHLSTLMKPVDRERVLAEIRRCLDSGTICRVVATSLIEAGVDVDFPVVYREEAGLDSLLQAAGRCNREGRRSPADSPTYIFRSSRQPPRIFEQQIAAMEETRRQYADIASEEAVRCYFRLLYQLRGAALDQYGILAACQRGVDGSAFPFRVIADRFHLIDTNTRTVYIPDQESREIFAQLQRGERNRLLLRQAGRYAVNIYSGHFQTLYAARAIEFWDDLAVLCDPDLYNSATGLSLHGDEGRAQFV